MYFLYTYHMPAIRPLMEERPFLVSITKTNGERFVKKYTQGQYDGFVRAYVGDEQFEAKIRCVTVTLLPGPGPQERQ
jgi:hypothetical protein